MIEVWCLEEVSKRKELGTINTAMGSTYHTCIHEREKQMFKDINLT